LDRILCAIPEHVYAVDRDGTILYTNLALAHAWGIGRNEMVGSTFRDIAQPQSAVERFEAMLTNVLETGRQETATFPVPYRSLGARDIHVVLTPVFETDGLKVKFVVGVGTDVTPTTEISIPNPPPRAGDSTQATTRLETGLTPRLEEVLTLIARGYSNKEIADELHISVRTVETHRRAITKRAGITTRAQIFRFAHDHGLVGA
jgi:PAS domain S-box-containing protein